VGRGGRLAVGAEVSADGLFLRVHHLIVDTVLERSQRLFEETFAPPLGPEPGRGRDR